jgi:stearoyl-CoA desaturase (delta-9 desaturase)
MKIAESTSSDTHGSVRSESVRPRLDLPEAARPVTIVWKYAISITAIHLLALLAFLPYYFSWTGVVLALVGHYVYGLFGVTLGYHRLLTHQGLVVPKWFERFCATCGVCSLEDTPARWVAIHRMHHKHSDEQDDPHSPLVNFLWSHVGWLLIRHREHSTVFFYEKYARDILRDPYYLWLERDLAWFLVYILHAVVYFAAGFGIGWLLPGGDVMKGVQFGASCLIWGVCVRTVTVWHGSWMVNSLTHVFGYRNYETKDLSRNQWFVALWAHGEGWHNNHHHDQRSAVHGHKWWEFDPTWCVIRMLMVLGIAKDVVMPRAWTKAEEAAPASTPKPAAADMVDLVKPEPVTLRNPPAETELPAAELAPVKAA